MLPLILLQAQIALCAADSSSLFVRDATGNFFDVFEPTYLKSAFTKTTGPSLAHLIFGDAWMKLNDEASCSFPMDPLTKAYLQLRT